MNATEHKILIDFIDQMNKTDYRHVTMINNGTAVSHQLKKNPAYLALVKLSTRARWDDDNKLAKEP